MVKSKVEANDETLKQIKDSMKEQNTKIQGAKDEFT